MSTKKEKSSMAQPLRMRRDYDDQMMDYDSSQLKVIPVEPEQKINIDEIDYDGKIIPKAFDDKELPPDMPLMEEMPPIEEAEVIEEDAPVPPAPATQPGTLGCPMCGQKARIRGDLEKLPHKMTCPHCGVSYPRDMVQSCGDGNYKFAAIPSMDDLRDFAKKEQAKQERLEKGTPLPEDEPVLKTKAPIVNFMTRNQFNPVLRLIDNVTKDMITKYPDAKEILDLLDEYKLEDTFKNEEELDKMRKRFRDAALKVTPAYTTFILKALDPKSTYTQLAELSREVNPKGLDKRKRTAAVYEKAAALLDLAKEFALLIKG